MLDDRQQVALYSSAGTPALEQVGASITPGRLGMLLLPRAVKSWSNSRSRPGACAAPAATLDRIPRSPMTPTSGAEERPA